MFALRHLLTRGATFRIYCYSISDRLLYTRDALSVLSELGQSTIVRLVMSLVVRQAKRREQEGLWVQTNYSLGPGSLVGNRAKKIGARSEPSGYWRMGEGSVAPSPLPYPFGSLHSPIFFALYPTKEPGPRLDQL